MAKDLSDDLINKINKAAGLTGNPETDELVAQFKASQAPQKESFQMPGWLKSVGEQGAGLGLGAMQGLGKMGASLANLPGEALAPRGLSSYLDTMNPEKPFGEELTRAMGQPQKPLYHIDEPNLQRFINPNQETAFNVGDIGAQVLAPMGATTKAIGAARTLPKIPRILSQMGIGGGIEYGLGEFAPGGREMAGAVGALFGPLAAGSAGNIAETTVAQLGKSESQVAKLYDAVFEQLGKQGRDLPISKIAGKSANDLRFGNYLTGADREVFADYLKNPTMRTAQEAKSMLKAEERALKNVAAASGGTLDPANKKAFNIIQDAIGEIDKKMEQGFSKAGKPNAWQEYRAVDQEFATQVVPQRAPAVTKYRESAKGSKSAEKAVKSLKKDTEFMDKMAKEYPELMINSILNALNPAKGVVKPIATLLGGGKLVDALMNNEGDQ